MGTNILISPPRQRKEVRSSDGDEQFKKKMSELDAKLSELTALFSGENAASAPTCAFCSGENARKSGACPFCKSDIIDGASAQKQAEVSAQEKIFYVVRGDKPNDVEWHRISNAAAANEEAEKKYGYGLTIEEVIAQLSRKGWVVSQRDESVISLSKTEKPFNFLVFLFLLCLLVFPALIYALGARPPKTTRVTFPLK